MRQGLGARAAALAVALALAAAVAACGGDDGTGGTAKPAADQEKAGRTAPKPAPRARRHEKTRRAARRHKRKRKRRVVVVKAPKVGATTKPERASGFPKGKSWRAPKQVASFDACMRRAQSYAEGKRCYDQFQQATGGKGISSPAQVPKPGLQPGD